jgi:hypothetical protein
MGESLFLVSNHESLIKHPASLTPESAWLPDSVLRASLMLGIQRFEDSRSLMSD